LHDSLTEHYEAALSHANFTRAPGQGGKSPVRPIDLQFSSIQTIPLEQPMATLKLIAVGTSTGVVFPKEMLARMNVDRGDKLHVVETPDGYLITPYYPAVAAQVEAGSEFMKEYRETFKVLAK
jgi:putative addiction module antidote